MAQGAPRAGAAHPELQNPVFNPWGILAVLWLWDSHTNTAVTVPALCPGVNSCPAPRRASPVTVPCQIHCRDITNVKERSRKAV